MMIDLSLALNCIKVMKENGTYRGQKIGRVNEDFPGMVGGYNVGRIVLYYEFTDIPPRLVIETPMTQEEIDCQRAERSLLTTTGCMVGVPSRYIEEIRL